MEAKINLQAYTQNSAVAAAPREWLKPYNRGSLARVLEEAPFMSRCSDNKTAARLRPREFALRYPYMQVNRPGMVSWLIFDLDHDNPYIWEDQVLPAPNIIVSNRSNGHAHLFYAILPVCTTEAARSKPIQYMKAIYEAMAERLGADLAYSGPVAKTPGHSWWNTQELHTKQFELGELAEYVSLKYSPQWSQGPDLDAVSHSRHCLLFEELRFYAYSIVTDERDQGSLSQFTRRLETRAWNINNFRARGFTENLSISQVSATVKSIARWTWDRYTGSCRANCGVMRLDPNTPLTDRQRQSANRTHTLRRRVTESRIRTAVQQLIDQDERVTQKALVSVTGLSRATIARYNELIVQALSEGVRSNVISLEKVLSDVENVSYGVYQISAVCGQVKNPALICADTSAQEAVKQPFCDSS